MDFSESENFNADEIAEETAHLKETLELMREQIALLENDGFAYRTVDIYDERDVEEYRTDKFRHDERKRDIKILKAALGTPYFARMRLKQIECAAANDAPSMTRRRTLAEADMLPIDADIYVGAHVIIYKDKILVYSHNSPLGNRVYDRFENGEIEYGGYRYHVVFRRKFDIRDGKLIAVFQDYSDSEGGGVVYDKFLAHMLAVKRGDKRLTDIIPTIQANQNAIITRPADENCVVAGCAGCGKTMILLQRLEYLSFNRKIELEKAVIIAPSERYIEHIQPVVEDLMITSARRMTLAALYRELILSLRGIKPTARRAISDGEPCGDETLPASAAAACYSDAAKRKLIAALKPVKQSYAARHALYRAKLVEYEAAVNSVFGAPPDLKKPVPPVVSVDLGKFPFLPRLGERLTKAKLYLLLTAYCYILGKPSFDSALFIDEGQEYFLNEYRLLAECTRATVNIYGDENQQLDPEYGIGSFKKLDALWELSHYSLNENYRNAREITAFVNGITGMNVTSLGLEGGTVERTDISEIAEKAKAAAATGDRIAVIYSPSDAATADALKSMLSDKYLCTVKESKGLEYERVFACGEMSDREKYVAYTRALSELVICDP